MIILPLSAQINEEEELDLAALKDYISYGKNNVTPKLSEDASQTLVSSYVKMRKVDNILKIIESLQLDSDINGLLSFCGIRIVLCFRSAIGQKLRLKGHTE